MLAAVAEIDEHLKNHVLGRTEGRRIKAATRESVYEYLKVIGRVLPPGADQDIFRQDRVRTAHEQVEHLVLAL